MNTNRHRSINIRDPLYCKKEDLNQKFRRWCDSTYILCPNETVLFPLHSIKWTNLEEVSIDFSISFLILAFLMVCWQLFPDFLVLLLGLPHSRLQVDIRLLSTLYTESFNVLRFQRSCTDFVFIIKIRGQIFCYFVFCFETGKRLSFKVYSS